jgi:hypothetical protein
MRKSWVGAIGAIAVAGAVLTPTAAFADTGPSVDTTTTFDVSSGLLTVTAPDTASLGTGAPGTTISGSLGTVTVNDNRALLSASWTATASASNFTTGGGTANETVPATDIRYTVGTITDTGTITTAGTNLTPMTTADQTVVTGSAGDGDNAASWNPTLAVAVPGTTVTGVYSGTITHSVA